MNRPEHTPTNHPICDCGIPSDAHRQPRKRERTRITAPRQWWGLDGEGQGKEDHRYTLLACVSESGESKYIECKPEKALSTIQCLEFLLSLPYNRIFAYSFNYDLTKILKDLDNWSLYRLFHEDKRQRKNPEKRKLGPRPISWGPYILNLQRTKFTVRRKGSKRTVLIWDIWKFFQGKFTSALEAWGIGDTKALIEMSRMKDQRADFDKLTPEEVRTYCFDECQKMAQLAHKLTDAHEAAGLNLSNYYGAGSTASAMLRAMKIKELRGNPPDDMKEAIAGAFFGGRFENSVIGPIPGDIWSYDISSAYPYELCFLPCLVHGVWSYVRREKYLERARAAIVRYSLGKALPEYTWGPFPFRLPEGSIAFPIESAGGWVYLDEYQQAKELFPHIRFHEAYILESDCNCQPFAKIPEYYRERIKLGKDARGIVLKLGMNSCYGKLAQSLGDNPPFQSWIWAGMITSGTRAQILQMASRLSSLDQLLMVATDGVYTRERVTNLPRPLNTGTYDLPKPLGGWEEKRVPQGVFAARPGIYFPLAPTDGEIKEVRARGIGKAVLFECWDKIVDAWNEGKETVTIDEYGNGKRLSRFIGAKSAINHVGDEYRRSKQYGQWVHRPIEMSFNPLPKRERIMEDGVSLELRSLPGQTSMPYKRAIGLRAPEAILLQAAQIEADQQPDGGDFVNY